MKLTHNNVKMTKRRKDLVTAAAFIAKRLKIDKFNFTLAINFKHGFTELCQAHAQVYYINERRIQIEIDASIPELISIEILAHEMVHVRQYLTKILAEDSKGLQLWNGKHIPEDTPYHKQPWEVEAMKAQTVLKWEYIYFRDGKT